MTLPLLLLLFLFSGGTATMQTVRSTSLPSATVFSLEARVACQQAIEAVYWQHRLWPAGNGPKPALDVVLPADVLRARVEETLRKSNAIEQYAAQPISGEMLQAEMARMARETRQPEVLRELWTALDDDPALIAECLARPALAEGLLAAWHAQDEHASEQPFETWWQAQAASISADLTPPAFDYRLPEISGSDAPDGVGTWIPTPALPDRTNGTAVWTGTEMIIWGGGTLGTGRSDEGSRYNPATDAWFSTTTVNAPMGRYGHTAVWTGTEMIVWGGCSASDWIFCELGNGGRYNPVTDTWSTMSNTNAAAPRMDHTAVWTGTEMIVWGGCAPQSSPLTCAEKNTGGRYDPATDTWTPTSLANAPSPRVYHSAVWTDSEMIVWGGDGDAGVTNTGGRYDPATDSWSPTSTVNAPSARLGHTAVWTGSEMIVWGGCGVIQGCLVQGDALGTGGRYDPATDSWTPTSTTNAPSGRVGHTAVWTGSEMIVWGGGTSNNIYYNTGARYNPATDSWTPISTAGAPTARANHRAVWTGSEMIVWGGSTPTGGRYNPDTNSWTPTSVEDPNTRRANHTAVWTGTEMIIWGGNDVGEGTTNTGRIYNPTTRTWRETSLVNAPSWRHFHTAIWTGTEMIIWGGQYGSTVYNDGGRYNPMTDIWTSTRLLGAPAPRSNHTAVWTGNEMIVWGGSGNTYYMNTGGRYNPSTNSWSPTSTAGTPPGRYLHTAVWTGEKMIVWGGLDATGDTNTGGEYDPATNSWALTPTASAPTPRHFHTAIWTGNEMVVWGGSVDAFGINPVNTGGRYDPDSNAWSPTNVADAPGPRAYHTAVWTGEEMIVWGGLSGGLLYTGGHYDPTSDSWEPTPIGPSARAQHTAVWTGTAMIIWGGENTASSYTNTGAEYYLSVPTSNALYLPLVAR